MLASEYDAWCAQIDLTDNYNELRRIIEQLKAMSPVMPMLLERARNRGRDLSWRDRPNIVDEYGVVNVDLGEAGHGR